MKKKKERKRNGNQRGHPVKLRRTMSHAASNPFVSGEA